MRPTVQTLLRLPNRVRAVALVCAALALTFIAPRPAVTQQRTPDYKNARLPVERRVADLLGRMTLEEKVAQLVCLWGARPQVGPQTDFSADRGDFSPQQASAVMKHGIGQIARQRERGAQKHECARARA